jgi:cysteinyl-tRNA synthetase
MVLKWKESKRSKICIKNTVTNHQKTFVSAEVQLWQKYVAGNTIYAYKRNDNIQISTATDFIQRYSQNKYKDEQDYNYYWIK